MVATGTGLSSEEVKALLHRYLGGEPGVVLRPLKGGLGCLCGGAFGQDHGAPRLFAVGVDGGVLVRLPDEARDKIVENRVGIQNAALPEWVLRSDPDGGNGHTHADAETHGDPAEWVWIPLADGEAFERRKPHVHEALEYCRHRIAARRR